ncbi:uncharacterized protein LOC116778025 isoform X2 [Danaus plexippus]|uniref:Uncharacterized protein n=1 Tax=Danaus plexippus plexippus TaxID=278856 RepID=A0A212FDR5_DANPL|nr:uncharacterized protein LOC116778025 isoform X2 [Danaus plexippus]OWR51915.1 hypothetical protein KGM_207195 [Danaus plexippus plexippus]
MQENNNFETIIQKWRRLSVVEQVEQKETVAIASMSGDSSNQQTLLKKKEEDIDLFGSGKSGNASVAVAGAGVVTSTEIPPDIVYANPEEKNESQEFIRRNKEDSKEAAGDTKDIGSVDKNGLESRKDENSLDPKSAVGPLEDNVDSVFLRSQPAHKVRSTASTVEEEDCGIKCLYYTLQCCDCVLM